ncbi:16S rRNA (guanine(527)-N(7))-methyltransferase RsmG [Novosphingobium lentum]|uniref:16S rRNA (guanine(527)-N(7))-methyltransferase RsmG n=1 Tax=Novosphingobium lentum TaxID=145287 RepID=UPI00082EEAB2|nr:16S rRNA (guanine(527)-N(7))-methyltransferase RsmG [Novosphingobium lentum]
MIDSEDAARAWLVEGLGIDSAAMARLSQLVTMLIEENERQNLVSRGSLAHVWQRHIADSAQLLCVPRGTPAEVEGDWLDLGSGAGFPGLVIAALDPARRMTLVDSRKLRTEWLSRAAAALGLSNVEVVLSRVEDLPPRQFSVISARAFAPLDKLLTLSARFSTPATTWLLPKGAKAHHELHMLNSTWRHMFHVEQSLTDPAAGIVVGTLPATLPVPRSTAAHTGNHSEEGLRR